MRSGLFSFGFPSFRGRCGENPGFRDASSTEEKLVQFALPQYTRRFRKGEERDESAKHDQSASQQLIEVPTFARMEGCLSEHKFLDSLENVESCRKQAEC